MKTLELHNSELVFRNPKINTFIDSYIFTGENSLEKKLGQILLAVETEEGSIESAEVSQGIAEVLKNAYYREATLKPEQAFEKAIIKINEILSDLIAVGKSKWLGKLNVVATAVIDQKIILTQTGKAQALLFRGAKEATVITEDLVSQDQKHSPQIFPNLLSGKLEKNDILLLATPALFNYFSDKKLAQVINQTKSASQAKEAILKEIKYNNINQNIAIIVTKAKAKVVVSTMDSYSLVASENEQVGPNIAKKHLNEAVSRRLAAKKQRQPIFKLLIISQELFKYLLHYLLLALKWCWQFSRIKLGPKLLKLLGLLIKKISNLTLWLLNKIKHRKPTGARVNLQINSPSRFSPINGFLRQKNYLRKLGQLPKPAMAVLVVTAALVVASLALKNNQSDKIDLAKVDYDQLLTQAEQKQKEATQSLIFKDDQKAKELLNEAVELNQQILGISEYKTRSEDLQKRIETDLAALAKQNEPSNLNSLIDLIAFKSTIQPGGIILDQNQLWLFDKVDNNIYQIRPDTKSITALNPSFQDIGHLASGAVLASGQSLVFVSDKGELINFQIKNNSLSKETAASDKPLKAVTGYQGNIYGLTQNGQEILKYLSTLTGLSKPQNWLKTTGAIADGQSLAIDGLIYVTQASGQIKKFLSGEEQSISQPQIDPKLTGVAKIYTQTTLKYLYILDNQNKRLLVLDKNGNLVKQ